MQFDSDQLHADQLDPDQVSSVNAAFVSQNHTMFSLHAFSDFIPNGAIFNKI